MKTITIDFSEKIVKFPDGEIIGCEGIHNSVTLRVILPERLICKEIQAYTMVFRNGEGETVLSDELLLEENSVSCVLWEQLLCGKELSVQVQGVGFENGKVTVIDKTPVAELEIERSINGKTVPSDYDAHAVTAQLTTIREKLAMIEILGSINGVCLSKSEINSKGELLLTYSNGKTYNIGLVKGENGENGVEGRDGEDGAHASHSWSGTTLTVTSASGTSSADLKGDKGDKGDRGDKGSDGKDGYTPVKGVDYWTASDKAEMNADNITYISAELAKRGQLKPEFAPNIEGCTDTSKLYVLPDGYVYAFMHKIITVNPTNQIPLSINTDKTPYNSGTGIKSGYRLNSSGAETTSGASGYSVTGFIPAKFGNTLRFLGINSSSASDTNTRICFYDASFAYINSLVSERAYNALNTGEYSLTDTLVDYSSMKSIESTEYIRVSGKFDSSPMITVNELLEGGRIPSVGFHSTGHAFVPADYENRIINLEDRLKNLSVSGSNIPMYVISEADRVAKNVYAKQNANTFSFLAISDAHYLVGNANIENSILHAGQGMNLVRQGVNIDFGVVLGDNGWGSGASSTSSNRATIEMGIEEIRNTNKCIDESFRGIPNFRSVGNHDSLIYNYSFNGNDYIKSSELFPLYGAYNRGAVFHNGNKERGYCYRDFDDWKLRVICLNTSDIQGIAPSDTSRPIAVSPTQGQWFAETLDMSSKADASEWSILILSHAPLDWGRACIYLCDILKAYIDGTECTVTTHNEELGTISYNYAGKNAATIIGNCHGHNHNFKVDNLRRLVSGNTTEPIDIKRFCIPNACFDRANERGENEGVDVYDIEYGEETSYKKVADTEKDTAFCVVTIDTVERKIYADAYGAGYDREISY